MKILRYFFLLIFSLIWIISLSPELSSKMTAADSYRFGDLYRLSNLSQFKDPRKDCPDYNLPSYPKASKKVHLYVIGDSFTEKQRVEKKDFAVGNYTYVHWSEALHVKPDTSEFNILLLETVERHFREKFTNSPIQNLVPDSATFIAGATSASFMNKLDNTFDSKITKVRLDEVLLQNNFVLALKQLKADFNYKVFDRTNQEVTSVNNGKDLVYYMDTDTDSTKFTSSFADVKNSEIDSIVKHLNQSREIALKIGFNAVILSVIPNKVSVLMPDYGSYNNLITRTYSHPNLNLPYVDVYADFRKLGSRSYLKGDSHWTCEGQYLWLDKTNAMIDQLASTPNL